MQIEICDADPRWPQQFAVVGAALRSASGVWAMRIDHIGSTSVPGLAAKPLLDVPLTTRRPTVDHYAEAKGDVVWTLLREADVWSFSGWQPGPSDA